MGSSEPQEPAYLECSLMSREYGFHTVRSTVVAWHGVSSGGAGVGRSPHTWPSAGYWTPTRLADAVEDSAPSGKVPVNWKVVPVLASRPLFRVMVQMFFASSVLVAVKSPSFHV